MAWAPVTTKEGARAVLAMRASCKLLERARPGHTGLPWPWSGMGFLRTALAVGTGCCEVCGAGDVLDVVERPCPVFAHAACTTGRAVFRLADMTTPELIRVLQARVPLQTIVTPGLQVVDAWAWRHPVRHMDPFLAAQPVLDAAPWRFALLHARASRRCPPVPVHLRAGLAAHVAALRQRNALKDAGRQRLLDQERALCQQRQRKRQRVETQVAACTARLAKLDARLATRGLPTAAAACARFGMHAMAPLRVLAAPAAVTPKGASIAKAVAAVEAAVEQQQQQQQQAQPGNLWRQFEEEACRRAGEVPGVCPALLMAWYTWAASKHEWPTVPYATCLTAEVAVAVLACSPGRHWQDTSQCSNVWLAVRAMQLGLTYSWNVSVAPPNAPSLSIIGLNKRHGWHLMTALKTACEVPSSELRSRWERRASAALAVARLPAAECPWEDRPAPVDV